MSVWHGDSRKKKLSGGRKRSYRKKRRFERGSFPAETTLGERKLKKTRMAGGKLKVRALKEKQANVYNPKTGKTEKTEILKTTRNLATVDYDRRGVITKGAIIETKIGPAKVTSRPGQHGLVNAILVQKEAKR